MDQLLNQLTSGIDQEQLAQMLGLQNGVGGKKDEGEESLDEDEKMENVKQLYNVFVKHDLKQTSHTVEWLPLHHQDADNSQFDYQYFLIGTHSESEDAKEYLQVVRFRMPNQPLEKIPLGDSKLSQIEVVSKIEHENEVIKARLMPNSDKGIIASMTNSGLVNIYEFDGLRTREFNESKNELKQQLEGLDEESFSLNWNQNQKGLLIAAALDKVCIWNVDQGSGPLHVYEQAHGDTQINDANFSKHEAHGGNLFISTADDGHFKIWDLRQPEKKFVMAYKDAEQSLCVGQFSPHNQHIFAVGGDSTGIINIWDMRMPQEAMHMMAHHQQQVTSLQWCPSHEGILASGSDDHKVYVWDLSMAGLEQARNDYEDGPPDLIFPHMYHSSIIEDLQWCPSPGYLSKSIASLETNTELQVWQMNNDFMESEMDILHLAQYVQDDELE